MATTNQDNKTVIRQFITDIVNDHNYDRVDDLFSHDYIRHDPDTPGNQPGLETWLENLKTLHHAFPDGEVHIGELIAEDDLVAFEGTMTGTHTGEFNGIDPTGIAFEIQGNAMHRVEDGQITETWATWDFLGFLNAVDAVDIPR